ncbi:hypothetical protein LTR10_011819 [Elasticomyces elasticus]|uniref:Major facilitator superfamily (MFS) profile domain-containing protein n=1 Tax=Exophiala sideris TaxID=1016849 RepID=A0ABR0JE64_9EURO|nr:hypothetical protein LTR10_011819 [Elasticomyces elasticus]KAK5031724.1 hypothetical protein LTS07_004344 [Exophiala sideris]KAK5040653.1 hypothetical protein LTR13_002953 [Exophiala sideris]KAK5062013.1 hypothetical protein LTR69_005197 [Exophiala sideris]KAK5184713.1 hypothetical protein LTR44_003388 [Eurotiomycetes sp. CCFEE 6388]
MASEQKQSADTDIAVHHHEHPNFHGPTEDKLDPHIRDDHGDPHRAALEDIDASTTVTKSTYAAVFFLGFTFQPSLSFAFYCALPLIVPMSEALQGNTNHSNWIASGWSLAGSVAFAIAGQLSDYFGRRYILMFGQVLLIIGHIIAATANNLNQAIAGMVIIGFGTGSTFVLYPGISELLPNRYRSIGLAWTELNLLPFATFGPLIARTLTANASWRWVYILGAITGVISVVGTAVFYHPPSHPLIEISRRQLIAEVDYLGIVLYSVGIALFLIGLNWGGLDYPWVSAAVLVPLILGILIFASAFVWDFSGRPKRPLFPARLIKRYREYLSLLIFIFVVGMVYFSMGTLLPQQIAYMYTSDPIKAGLYNIPGGFAGAGGGVFLGGLIAKMKRVQWQLFTGVVLQTVCVALYGILTPDRLAAAIVLQFFANLPFAWITLACYIIAGLNVPQRDLGLALGLVGTFRFLGGAVGTTIFASILANRAATTTVQRTIEAVLPLGFPRDQVPALMAAVASGKASLLSNYSATIIKAAQVALQWGYSDAFRVMWLATIPFGVIASCIALWVPDVSPYFTQHTAVTLEKNRLGEAQQSEEEKVVSEEA